MTIPDDLNEWEHLQDQIIKIHNRQVNVYFNDVTEEDGISTPRGSLRWACLMKDEDTSVMTQLRLWLFEVTAGHAQSLQAPIYGIPTDHFQDYVTFKPQVKLHFLEDHDTVEPGYRPIRAEIAFRWMNQTADSVTPSEAKSLANTINGIFGGGTGYRFHKGRVKCVYKDPQHGYNLTIHGYTETDGREVIERVLEIQGHAPDWTNLVVSQLATNPPTVPPLKLLYGKERRLPRKRPVGYVRFRRAELHLWGVTKAIVLIDKTGRYRNALISPIHTV